MTDTPLPTSEVDKTQQKIWYFLWDCPKEQLPPLLVAWLAHQTSMCLDRAQTCVHDYLMIVEKMPCSANFFKPDLAAESFFAGAALSNKSVAPLVQPATPLTVEKLLWGAASTANAAMKPGPITDELEILLNRAADEYGLAALRLAWAHTPLSDVERAAANAEISAEEARVWGAASTANATAMNAPIGSPEHTQSMYEYPLPIAPPVQPADKGPWKVAVRGNGEVVLESDDFVHDVVLVVEGDFERSAQAKEYAALLAHQMNSAQPVQPASYGKTDFGFTFAGAYASEGAKRLMAMLVDAFGTDHPSVDDLTALIFSVAAQPVQPAKQETK